MTTAADTATKPSPSAAPSRASGTARRAAISGVRRRARNRMTTR
ncbi:Uncharacterised protein [Mycobacteroides abscessus]|nr:Uncharacterised protein [Mycobacteroides abscessus]